jgi:hypothetical protein
MRTKNSYVFATTACSHRVTSTSRRTSAVVKPSLVHGFDYRKLHWAEDNRRVEGEAIMEHRRQEGPSNRTR